MRAAALAATVLGTLTLNACDALLVDPTDAASGPALSLSLVAPLSAPPEYPGFGSVLEQVTSVSLGLIREEAERDTIVSAYYAADALHLRVTLRPEEVGKWLEMRAELRMEGGAPLFRGRGVLDGRLVSPRAHVEIEPVPASLSVPPWTEQTSLGVLLDLEAIPRFATGDTILGAVVEWMSSAPDIVEVLPSGDEAITRSNGVATLTASVLGVSRGSIAVVQQHPSRLTGITPTDTTISVGESFLPRLAGVDANFYPLLPGAFAYWYADGDVAVDSTGLVTGVASGAGTVEARYVGFENNSYVQRVSITVLP